MKNLNEKKIYILMKLQKIYLFKILNLQKNIMYFIEFEFLLIIIKDWELDNNEKFESGTL